MQFGSVIPLIDDVNPSRSLLCEAKQRLLMRSKNDSSRGWRRVEAAKSSKLYHKSKYIFFSKTKCLMIENDFKIIIFISVSLFASYLVIVTVTVTLRDRSRYVNVQ